MLRRATKATKGAQTAKARRSKGETRKTSKKKKPQQGKKNTGKKPIVPKGDRKTVPVNDAKKAGAKKHTIKRPQEKRRR